MAVQISLNRGFVALIDEEDVELLRHKWSAGGNGSGRIFYVRRSERLPNGKHRAVSLHREVMRRAGAVFQPGVWLVVDHINGDTMDNRRANLRLVTQRENLRNCPIPQSNGTSGFRGVTFCRREGKWRAYLHVDGRMKQLGMFATAEDANAARLEGEAKFWGVQPRRAAA